ncbi:MAG: hypothetical protein WAM66_03330 [Acidobacteriaceae bacterium]
MARNAHDRRIAGLGLGQLGDCVMPQVMKAQPRNSGSLPEDDGNSPPQHSAFRWESGTMLFFNAPVRYAVTRLQKRKLRPTFER